MNQSQAEWIAFLDDDDILYPWHFESLLQAAQQSGRKFIYGDYNRALFLTSNVTTPDNLTGAPPWEFVRNQLLVQNFIPIHTWLFARTCLDKTGLIDENLDRLEDYDLLVRMSSIYPFHHLKKVTCEYRYYIHSANSIYTDRQKTLDALKIIYQRYPVEDRRIILDRQELLQGMEKQIMHIEDIRKQIGVSLTEVQANRGAIQLVIGL
jgi:hypothetical protein